ncbi:hypothetical protein LOAG_06162, partial [Loa loa]
SENQFFMDELTISILSVHFKYTKATKNVLVVQMRFTKLGFLICIGGSLYCCIGFCCLFLLRQRHCPLCYKKDFEKVARVRRRIQCLVDDKSELYVTGQTSYTDILDLNVYYRLVNILNVCTENHATLNVTNEYSKNYVERAETATAILFMTARTISDFITYLLIYYKDICIEWITMPLWPLVYIHILTYGHKKKDGRKLR